ncbi:hypothetical protein ABTY61_13650 [Kitasatospora sp. NPDC096128]|uniref:hypothetical protein n=1 Tax=Kitasatospora sp. NPDC096128 TaxID=3155547 RepID=UPI00331E6209
MTFSGSAGRSGLVVGAVLLLAACSGGGGGGGGAAAPSATPSAAATPFGTSLDQALGPVGTGLGKVSAAKDMGELDRALGAVESSTGRAVRDLNSAAVPAGATAGRTDLVNALTALATDASAVRVDVQGKKLCALAVGQGRLGAGQGMAGVTAALGKLKEAGFPATATVPQLPALPAQPRTLENGTLVRDGGKGGTGTLEVTNNFTVDAVFTLAADGKAVASVYAAKGQQATVTGIADGSYDFYYTTGVDWDPDARQFTQNCDFVKFQDKHEFTPDGGGTIWKVTVHAKDGQGNAKVEGQNVNSAPQP